MSKAAALMSASATAKKAADDAAAAAETERLRPRSFDTRSQDYGHVYSYAATSNDDETLGGMKRKGNASRAILG